MIPISIIQLLGGQCCCKLLLSLILILTLLMEYNMEPQEVFDKVVAHLLTQKVQSEENELSKYYGPNGLKCAVGCLIPPDLYNSEIEGISISLTYNPFGILIKSNGEHILAKILNNIGISENTPSRELLMELQVIHDCLYPKEWFVVLRELAIEFDLSTEVLNKFN